MPRLVVIGPPGAGKSVVVGWWPSDSARPSPTATRSSSSGPVAASATSSWTTVSRLSATSSGPPSSSCSAARSGVLSLGGGAVIDPRTEADLTGHVVVFLDVGISDAAKRVGFATSRPLLSINPRAQWTALMTTRRPVYERAATFTVDTAAREADDVAAEVVERLHQHEERA
jgi:shikimate kinase